MLKLLLAGLVMFVVALPLVIVVSIRANRVPCSAVGVLARLGAAPLAESRWVFAAYECHSEELEMP